MRISLTPPPSFYSVLLHIGQILCLWFAACSGKIKGEAVSEKWIVVDLSRSTQGDTILVFGKYRIPINQSQRTSFLLKRLQVNFDLETFVPTRTHELLLATTSSILDPVFPAPCMINLKPCAVTLDRFGHYRYLESCPSIVR